MRTVSRALNTAREYADAYVARYRSLRSWGYARLRALRLTSTGLPLVFPN